MTWGRQCVSPRSLLSNLILMEIYHLASCYWPDKGTLTFGYLLASIRLPMTKYIISTPNIMGGEPVIAGTRIPISRIVYLLSQGYNVHELHKDYPWVNVKVLRKVIDEIVEIVNTSPDVTKVSQVQTAA